MTRKKKLLPKDFEELLKQGDLNALKAVFDTCEIDARGGYGKQTALSFDLCPDELARFLVERGADLAAKDTWGNTALHTRARSWRGSGIAVLLELGADANCAGSKGAPLHAAAQTCNTANARQLLAAGARVDTPDAGGLTPLELALSQCSNTSIPRAVEFCETLLAAGAARTSRLSGFVTEIGKRFEFFRASFNKDSVEEVSAALDRLYAMFDAPPVPRRAMHDGRSPIHAKAATWQDQHEELWQLLVPAQGAAATQQGEVIRLSGRISHEIDGNGGVNWDADFDRMAATALVILASGHALSASDLREAATLVREFRSRNGNTARLAQMAVEWVLLNPAPVALGVTDYRR